MLGAFRATLASIACPATLVSSDDGGTSARMFTRPVSRTKSPTAAITTIVTIIPRMNPRIVIPLLRPPALNSGKVSYIERCTTRPLQLPVLPYSYLLRNPDSEEKLTKSGTSHTLDCRVNLAADAPVGAEPVAQGPYSLRIGLAVANYSNT